jgi:hypothetical protein
VCENRCENGRLFSSGSPGRFYGHTTNRAGSAGNRGGCNGGTHRSAQQGLLDREKDGVRGEHNGMHSRGNPGRQNIHYGDINRRNDEKTPLILPNCKLQRPLALDDLAQKAVNAQPQRTARKNGAGPGQAGGTGAQQAHGFYDAGLLLGHLLDHGSAGLLGVFQLVDALLQLDDVLQGQLTSIGRRAGDGR